MKNCIHVHIGNKIIQMIVMVTATVVGHSYDSLENSVVYTIAK